MPQYAAHMGCCWYIPVVSGEWQANEFIRDFHRVVVNTERLSSGAPASLGKRLVNFCQQDFLLPDAVAAEASWKQECAISEKKLFEASA